MQQLWMSVWLLVCMFSIPFVATAADCNTCHDPGIQVMDPINLEQSSNDQTTKTAYVTPPDADLDESVLYSVVPSDYIYEINYERATPSEGVANFGRVIRVQDPVN